MSAAIANADDLQLVNSLQDQNQISWRSLQVSFYFLVQWLLGQTNAGPLKKTADAHRRYNHGLTISGEVLQHLDDGGFLYLGPPINAMFVELSLVAKNARKSRTW